MKKRYYLGAVMAILLCFGVGVIQTCSAQQITTSNPFTNFFKNLFHPELKSETPTMDNSKPTLQGRTEKNGGPQLQGHLGMNDSRLKQIDKGSSPIPQKSKPGITGGIDITEEIPLGGPGNGKFAPPTNGGGGKTGIAETGYYKLSTVDTAWIDSMQVDSARFDSLWNDMKKNKKVHELLTGGISEDIVMVTLDSAVTPLFPEMIRNDEEGRREINKYEEDLKEQQGKLVKHQNKLDNIEKELEKIRDDEASEKDTIERLKGEIEEHEKSIKEVRVKIRSEFNNSEDIILKKILNKEINNLKIKVMDNQEELGEQEKLMTHLLTELKGEQTNVDEINAYIEGDKMLIEGFRMKIWELKMQKVPKDNDIFNNEKTTSGSEKVKADHKTLWEQWTQSKSPSKVSNPNYISVTESLDYVSKGSKESLGPESDNTTIHYLELSVTGGYNHILQSGKAMIHAGLGPFIAMGLSGKEKYSGGGQSGSLPVKFGKNGGYSRMDYGAKFNAGVSFAKRWDVSAGYDLGLANITPGGGSEAGKTKTRSVSLGVGYRFK